MATNKKHIDTSTASLEYVENIVYMRIKEKSVFTPRSLEEHNKAQEELTGNDEFAILVDGRNSGKIDPVTMKFAGEYRPVNRKAIAIVTNNNLVTLMMGNIYIKVNGPITPTRLFNHETEAVAWLKDMLKR